MVLCECCFGYHIKDVPYLTLPIGVMHKILQLDILVGLLDCSCYLLQEMHAFWKLGGNCTASVWFSYMAHVIFKLKVQKYFGTLLGNSCKNHT